MINVVCSLACLVRHTHGTLRVCSADGVCLLSGVVLYMFSELTCQLVELSP